MASTGADHTRVYVLRWHPGGPSVGRHGLSLYGEEETELYPHQVSFNT